MGHANVKTTEIYTHVMEKNIAIICSPLDILQKKCALTKMKADIIIIGSDIVGEQFGLESFDHEALVRLTAERLIGGSQ